MNKTVIAKCANCGASIDSINDKECKYCKAPIIIKTLADLSKISNEKRISYITEYKKILQEDSSNIPVSIALALCHVGAGNFSTANDIISKLILDDCDNPNVFYYKALCLLEGKRPRVLNYEQIKNVEKQLNSANALCGGASIYYIFQAILKLDFYEHYNFNRNCGKNSKELIEIANNFSVLEDEVLELLRLTGVDKAVCDELDKRLHIK